MEEIRSIPPSAEFTTCAYRETAAEINGRHDLPLSE